MINAEFETSSPQVINTLLTIATFPGGVAIMEFNNQTYEVTVKPTQGRKKQSNG